MFPGPKARSTNGNRSNSSSFIDSDQQPPTTTTLPGSRCLADERLVAHLMDARAAKQRDPGKVVVVGGCWSESMKDELFDRFPFVDLAFGPGNIHRLGDFIQAGGEI